MNFPTKKYLLEKLKSGTTTLVTLAGLIAFFVWFDTISEDTLISFKQLCIISFSIASSITFLMYQKGWGSFFKSELWLSFIGFLLTMYLSSYFLLGLNHLSVFGEVKQKEYAIKAIVEKKLGDNGDYHDFIKIIYHRKEMLIRSPMDDIYPEDFNVLILKTRKGILGWEVIQDKILIQTPN